MSFSQTRESLYCRPPGFTVVSPGKHLAGGLQSGRAAKHTQAGSGKSYPAFSMPGIREEGGRTLAMPAL